MLTKCPRQEGLRRIDALQRQASELKSRLNHLPLQGQVRFAELDLEEAGAWLNQTHVEQRMDILRIADTAINLAALRLALVAKALSDERPDAATVG
jgi:hypothetical protein